MSTESIAQPGRSLVDLLAERLPASEPVPATPSMPPATDDRAAFVAGLRQIADWYEQHPEIAPPSYPDVTQSLGQSGEWTTDDAVGIPRVEAFAAALGVEVQRNGHIVAQRRFGPVRLRGYYIPEDAR